MSLADDRAMQDPAGRGRIVEEARSRRDGLAPWRPDVGDVVERRDPAPLAVGPDALADDGLTPASAVGRMSAVTAPGSRRSSASRKLSHSPRATAKPRFRAFDTPDIRGQADEHDARIVLSHGLTTSAVPSVEPSSMTTHSSATSRSSRTESMARAMLAAAFQHGIRTDSAVVGPAPAAGPPPIGSLKPGPAAEARRELDKRRVPVVTIREDRTPVCGPGHLGHEIAARPSSQAKPCSSEPSYSLVTK